MAQRKRRQQLLAGAGALAFAIGTAVTFASFTGTDLADAAATRARNFMDLIDQRSPGARTEGQLTKTKGRHHVLAEHSLPAPVRLPANLAEAIAPPELALIPVNLGPLPNVDFLKPPSLGPIFAPPPGGGGGCCGGGGGGPGGPGGPPASPPIGPPPGIPAVPEPGTWLTMLLGFGFIGWSIRRNPAMIAVKARA
jgi:hypothetical protein